MIVVSGAVAYDRIAFVDRNIQGCVRSRDPLAATVRIGQIEQRFGGTGGNIAYNLRMLGETPLLFATAGRDFAEYASWLDRCAIDRRWLSICEDDFTASCTIVTDRYDNRFTLVCGGAMDRTESARLCELDEPARAGIVAAAGKNGMLAHAAELVRRGIPSIVDPGPAVLLFDRDELRALLTGASICAFNDAEWDAALGILGLEATEVLEIAQAVVVTHGAGGATLLTGGSRMHIPAVEPAQIVDPVGCGDAHRAGLLFALGHALDLEFGAKLGAVLASMTLEVRGAQGLQSVASIRTRFIEAFGRTAALELLPWNI